MGLISQNVLLPGWGKVHIRCLSTARNITARWRGEVLHVTVPPGVSPDALMKALDSMGPQLRSIKPEEHQPLYHDGLSYRTDGWGFDVHCEPRLNPTHIKIQPARDEESGRWIHQILYGSAINPADKDCEAFIAKNILRAARQFTQAAVIPEAMDIARTLGLSVREWDVMRGATRLGKCSATGKIWLNERLAFFDQQLRRFTITHELAHLTHFDHSLAFHALWEQYMGSPLAPARRRQRTFLFPLPR